jgi:MFS family permease
MAAHITGGAVEQRATVKRGSPRVFYGWVIVGAAFAVAFSEAPTRSALISVFVVPMSEDFNWSRTALTGAISLGAALSSVIAPVVGPILDRRGPRAVLVVSVAATGGAILGLAFVRSLWQFYVLMVLARALSSSAVMMATSVAVANWFIRRRGRAMAISRSGTWVAIPVFILLSQILLPLHGWRAAWMAMGAVTLGLALVPSFLMRRRPEDMGLLPDGDSPDAPSQGRASTRHPGRAVEINWSLGEAMRTRTLWLLILATGLGSMVTQAVNLHALASLTDRGISPAGAAGAVTFSLVVSGVVTLAWGLAVERIRPRYTAALALFCSAAGMAFLIWADSVPLAYAFGFIYGVGFGGFRIMEYILYADYFGRESLGTITGFAAPFHLVTNAGGPLLASLSYDLRGSYTAAFVVFLLSYLVAAAVMVLAAPPLKPSALTTA